MLRSCEEETDEEEGRKVSSTNIGFINLKVNKERKDVRTDLMKLLSVIGNHPNFLILVDNVAR